LEPKKKDQRRKETPLRGDEKVLSNKVEMVDVIVLVGSTGMRSIANAVTLVGPILDC